MRAQPPITRGSRAASEIMAAIMLTLIVISVGSVLVINYLSQSQRQTQYLEGVIDRATEMAAEPLFSILYTYYNTTPGSERLEIVIYTGPGVLELVGIYVNNTLVWEVGDNNVYLNGAPVAGALLLGDNTIYNLTIVTHLPLAPGEKYILKVATSTGTQATAVGEAH